MILHMDCRTFVITDERDRIVSLDNAKAFFLAGKIEDCNLGFQRLANNDFDVAKVEEFYANN